MRIRVIDPLAVLYLVVIATLLPYALVVDLTLGLMLLTLSRD